VTDPILQNSTLIRDQWELSCKEVLQESFYEWLPLYEVDLETGNPIYSIYEPSTNKAIRILHGHNALQFGVYMARAGTKDMEEDLISEVVFSLPFTKQAIELFKSVFKVWISSDMSYSYMTEFIYYNKSRWDSP
jgi:hypothetical protein